ncbi:hypothetical protein [Neisseria dumasiana]|uniref:hypothetical protein n=1 Tax=Neisseria dumasiana TaxID=1931275 RepID=UPI000A1995AC|nr:hypothetical protein [Neisseria dumasiana]OSI15183.1 hypothetical protein BV914_08215 [Neisseria dumasiana]
MKKIIFLFCLYSNFAVAQQNIFPIYSTQNLLGYGQLEFLKPNKNNISFRYIMKNKEIKLYSLKDTCYKQNNCVSEIVYLGSSPDGKYSTLMYIDGGLVEDLEENFSSYHEANNTLILNHKSGCLVMAPSKYYVNWKEKHTLSDGNADINLNEYFKNISIFYKNNKLDVEDYYGIDNVNNCRKFIEGLRKQNSF